MQQSNAAELTLKQIMTALNIKSATEENNEKMFEARRLNLSFMRLNKLNHLSLLNRLRELRLEHNALRSIPESINLLKELDILNLSHNKIVDGFKYLPQSLKCLDVSFNRIKRVPHGLPRKIVLLDLSSNPVCKFTSQLRPKLIETLPSLKWLNGDVVMPGERAGLCVGTPRNSSSSLEKEYGKSSRQVEMIREMFQELDQNKDGYVDYEEMRRFARLTGDPEIDVDDWTRITYYFSCNPDLGLRITDIYEMYFEPESATLFEVNLTRDYPKVLGVSSGSQEEEEEEVQAKSTKHNNLLDTKNIPSIEISREKVTHALQSFEKNSEKPCSKAVGDIKRIREEIQSRSKARQKKDGESTPR